MGAGDRRFESCCPDIETTSSRGSFFVLTCARQLDRAVSSVRDVEAEGVEVHPNPFEDRIVLEGLEEGVWP